jgi:hypothetical protein
MIDWVKGYMFRNICLGYNAPAPGEALYASVGVNGEFFAKNRLASSVQSVLAEVFLGSNAYADDIVCPGINATQKLMDLATDTARFGGDAVKAYKVAKSVRKALRILDDAGIVLSSQKSLDVMADIANHGGSEVLRDFAKNATKGFATSTGKYKLNLEDGALDALLGRVGKVPVDAPGYNKWIRKLSYEVSFAIKGVAGESEAIDKALTKYADKNPVLTEVSDKLDKAYEKLDPNAVDAKWRKGQDGVDGIIELDDGGKVFLESKVISGASERLEEDILDELAVQYRKHLITKVLPLVEKTPGGEVRFLNGMPSPILDYHLTGSWFTPERQAKILERFAEIMKDKELKQILMAEPKFKFDSSSITIGDLLPSIIN